MNYEVHWIGTGKKIVIKLSLPIIVICVFYPFIINEGDIVAKVTYIGKYVAEKPGLSHKYGKYGQTDYLGWTAVAMGLLSFLI